MKRTRKFLSLLLSLCLLFCMAGCAQPENSSSGEGSPGSGIPSQSEGAPSSSASAAVTVTDMKGREIIPCANYLSMNIFGCFAQANFRGDDHLSIYGSEGRLKATLSKKCLLIGDSLTCSTEYFAWIDDDGLLRIVDQRGQQVY